MEKKIPLNIGLEILVNPDVVRFNEFRFISPHFGFVNSFAKIESNLITIDQPYRIKEGRIAVIKQGYARVLINLIEETFQPDKLLLIVPNSILQIIEVSPDFDIEYLVKNNNQKEQSCQTHQEEIFQRFISLVNAYSKKERNVSFYADKLCLTPRYLNTIIRQTSQQTVMDWINQSIILEAKVLLKHSNLLVYQISDELNFPNPSFFSKFFKRMTGMTPHEYQFSK